MNSDKPISKCCVRGCPVIGYWAAGEPCPHHRQLEAMGLWSPPRRPTADESDDQNVM